MKIVDNTYINEIIIKKSKFIATLKRCDTIDEANDIIKDLRKKYYDANHNCFAYIIGDTGEITRQSDDGEPSKTAGLPILDVLKGNNITNTICVVTRYFGGTLLGTGGLVKAYSTSCIEVIKISNFIKKVYLEHYIFIINYDYLGVVERLLREKSNIISVNYSLNISFEVSFLNSIENDILFSISNLTNGSVEYIKLDPVLDYYIV